MGSAPYIPNELIDDDDSGIIQLGLDFDERLQIIPTESITLKTLREQQTLEFLRSIDNSLKTLLIYMQEITNEKFD